MQPASMFVSKLIAPERCGDKKAGSVLAVFVVGVGAFMPVPLFLSIEAARRLCLTPLTSPPILSVPALTGSANLANMEFGQSIQYIYVTVGI